MSDEDVELARLRERVYGGRGTAPTADEIARLSTLEDQIRTDPAPDTPAPPTPPTPDEPTDATPRTPRPVRRGILTA
ncbi:hypothetical protein WB472_47205, partial [Streptomyces brasiliscabiei]